VYKDGFDVNGNKVSIHYFKSPSGKVFDVKVKFGWSNNKEKGGYFMELNISIKNKDDIERFILILNVGMMTAIKEGVISIEEAENYLYSPYSVEKIRKLGINEDVIKLIELGCELEDVESLIPDRPKFCY